MSAGRKNEFALKQFSILAILVIIILLAAACGYETEAVTAEIPEETVPETVLLEPELPEETVAETEPAAEEEITFTSEFVRSEDVMPYALFTPSSAEKSEAVPLIVWLHGRGECDATEAWFMQAGLPQIMSEWSLDGFNAYVICPQLYGQWNTGYWADRRTAENLKTLLDRFVAEHNVDMENIIISGFSSGGRGAMFMALQFPDYFSRLVVMSSQSLDECDISAITIPTLGCSEIVLSYNAFMKVGFPAVFGQDGVWYYDVQHGLVPDAAFHDDKNGDHRSDLVDWMLGDSEAIPDRTQ